MARAAFESDALPHLDAMYRVALRLTRNPSEAEDLVQDALMRAYRYWDSFESGTSVKAWLLTILRNTFITGYHKSRRRDGIHAQVKSQVETFGEGASTMHVSQSGLDPERSVMLAHERDRILAGLASLPEDYRLAVVLADIEGLSYKEIAEVAQCPVGTVMSRIHRGRKLLHKLLRSAEAGDVSSRASADVNAMTGAEHTLSLDDFKRRRGQA